MANPNLPNNPGYNLYVGARYVPVFSDVNNGVWDANTAYEPLIIVSYLGDSYTSKTFVPVGVNPSNTTYWAKTRNYNVQIETINQRIDTLNTSISSLDGEVSNLNKSLLKKAPSSVYQDNIFCMGDSTNMSNGWASYVKNNTKCNSVTSLGNYGAGFTIGGTTPPYANMTFLQTLTAFVNTQTDETLQSFTKFVLVGGYNDSHNTENSISTINTAVKNFFSYVSTKFPNAKILFFPSSPKCNNGNLRDFSYLYKMAKNVDCYVKSFPNAILIGAGNDGWYSDAIHQTSYEHYSLELSRAIANEELRISRIQQMQIALDNWPFSSANNDFTLNDFLLNFNLVANNTTGISLKSGGGYDHVMWSNQAFGMDAFLDNRFFPATMFNPAFNGNTMSISYRGYYAGLHSDITGGPNCILGFNTTLNLEEVFENFNS